MISVLNYHSLKACNAEKKIENLIVPTCYQHIYEAYSDIHIYTWEHDIFGYLAARERVWFCSHAMFVPHVNIQI